MRKEMTRVGLGLLLVGSMCAGAIVTAIKGPAKPADSAVAAQTTPVDDAPAPTYGGNISTEVRADPMGGTYTVLGSEPTKGPFFLVTVFRDSDKGMFNVPSHIAFAAGTKVKLVRYEYDYNQWGAPHRFVVATPVTDTK